MIHGAISAENLFVTRGGVVKLLGFGLATLYESAENGVPESVPANDDQEAPREPA